MSALMDEIRAGEAPTLANLTVDQYHQLNEVGVLPDGSPIELIDGVLVLKDRRDEGGDLMTHGARHALTIQRMRHLLEPLVRPHGWHVRTQFPVTLPPDSEPEPDLAVVRGTFADYAERHPGPGDVALVVEVAFSSLSQDRRTKARLYAEAGFPRYWVVNLRAIKVETHSGPLGTQGYGQAVHRGLGDRLTFELGEDASIEVAVSDFLA